ncbi:MAG: hypothetical protein JJ863_01660 [Deltaproteobacteria bacterium]|nr:hypothetical protein [Deltaproteobacteria bacterium]
MELSNKALAFIADALRHHRDAMLTRAAEPTVRDDEHADLSNDAAFLAAILADVEAELARRVEDFSS